ncbi:protein shisa-9 isoform X2 [Anolis sagrei]|uniref:protein shisa-9 isoform X2 n=1 Tax=Anolis sagrei TaxID=38937 RepID=UPI00295A8EED|nr:protein shisa-9 isoform X2 [Anolis sagrei ordinatus]
MKGLLPLLVGYLLAQEMPRPPAAAAPPHLGSIVMLSGGNQSRAPAGPLPSSASSSSAWEAPSSASLAPPPGPEECRGYFDVMGQWDPSFNCSVREYPFCCGTCGFRFCCKYPKGRLDQALCTNYIKPPWLNGRKAPSRPADPSHDPTRDKTNLIVYIICGVVAVMVLVGIFTKLGLEKAHRPQREHLSRALADVMRPEAPCTTDHMERDLNIVVHVQHYENMETRPPANNLHATQMNNVVPVSPLLPQLTHPHSYPNMGQITNPYEQQPPGKELNKYASLKAVDKGSEDFYSKRRHLAELASKGTLPLHPVCVEEDRPYVLEGGTMKHNGQRPKAAKPHMHPLAYKTWDPSDQSLRQHAYATKGRNLAGDPSVGDPLTTRSQHYLPTQPYFITNSKTEVTV